VLATDGTVAGSGYELFYYTVSVYGGGSEGQRTTYELSSSNERRGALTSIGYPRGYPPSMVQRSVSLRV
jgi:hypothetical protein